MRRVREIITCLTLVALCGCGAEVAEPPTHEPEVVTVTPEVTPAAPTSAIVQQANSDEVEAVEAMRKVWNFEEGILAEDADRLKLQIALEKAARLPDGAMKENLYVMAFAVGECLREEEIIETGEDAPDIEVRGTRLYGTCYITHYCNCAQCCGKWAGGATASGTMPTAGRTVSMDLPFGTQVMIGNTIYTVEDRGVSGMWVDIYCNSHSEALSRGAYYTEVYIVE